MVWGVDGLMNPAFGTLTQNQAIDFAGARFAYSSGGSALIFGLILGKRLGFWQNRCSPHSMVFSWSPPAVCGSVVRVLTPAGGGLRTASPPTLY